MQCHALVRRARFLLFPFALAACCEITGSCETSDCTPEITPLTASFNTFAANGAPVATFRLTQDHLSPADGCNGERGGPVTLAVTGIAPVPLRFDYTLQGVGASGLVVWSNAGSVPRLAPGQTLNLGQVARTPVRVDVGARAILANIFTVP